MTTDNLKNVKFVRAGRFLYETQTEGPATVYPFPSKSAARRAVRGLGMPLGHVRKAESLMKEIGDTRFERLMTQGRDA